MVKNMWAIYTVKAVHFIICLINLAAIPTVLILQPWYVGIPIATLLIGITASEAHVCVLTQLENRLRAMRGLEPLETFVADIIEKIKRRV